MKPKITSAFLAAMTLLASSLAGQSVVFADNFDVDTPLVEYFDAELASRQSETTLPNAPYGYASRGKRNFWLDGETILIRGNGSLKPAPHETLAVDLGAALAGNVYAISVEIHNSSASDEAADNDKAWIGLGFGNETTGPNNSDVGWIVREKWTSMRVVDGRITKVESRPGPNTYTIVVDETGATATARFFRDDRPLNEEPVPVANLTGTERTFQINFLGDPTGSFDNLRIATMAEPPAQAP